MDLIQPFIEAKEKRIYELADLRRQGRKVIGFFCLHTPATLIEAAGGIPLRLCIQGDSFVQRSGEMNSRACICPFIKACLGHMEMKHPWFRHVDAFAACSTCDQMRHMADILRSRFDKPSYVFFQPRQLETKEATWIYHRELQWLFHELSSFCKTNDNQHEIQNIIDRHNSIRHHLLALHELRTGGNPLITGAQWFTVVQAGFVLSSRSYLDLLQDLLNKIKDTTVRKKAGVRIMLVGGMLAEGDVRIIRAIEDAGKAIIVTDALCTGTRIIGRKIAKEGDFLYNTIEAHRAKVPCIHARPNQKLYDYINRQIEQFGVDGVVFHTLKFCDGWGSEWFRMQQFLQERNIQSLVIDTDYGTSDTGQIATRVDAFLEMLQDKKNDKLTAKTPSR